MAEERTFQAVGMRWCKDLKHGVTWQLRGKEVCVLRMLLERKKESTKCKEGEAQRLTVI